MESRSLNTTDHDHGNEAITEITKRVTKQSETSQVGKQPNTNLGTICGWVLLLFSHLQADLFLIPNATFKRY